MAKGKRTAHPCAKTVMKKCSGVKGKSGRSQCMSKAWKSCPRKRK